MHRPFFFSAKSRSGSHLATRWLTVGFKLILGVAVASNGCIATLFWLNHHATQRMESMMAEVLSIREEVESNLRNSIVQLQRQFIHLPDLFTNDPKRHILEKVEQEFSIGQRLRLAGREHYAGTYSRAEKRDMAQGRLVTGIDGNTLILSHGVFNDQGKFTDVIEQLRLISDIPENDRQRLQAMIAEVEAKSGGVAFYEQKIASLRSLVADKSLEAEQSRTEILGYVDRINLQEQRMHQAIDQQRRQSLIAGITAIAINILVVFVLTRIIVERPLRRLTDIVEALCAGEFPKIPWLTRRDQIGVLCAAIDRFREALLRLNREERRKEHDRQRIGTLVSTMTETIHDLENRSTEMARVAHTLQTLAGQTEQTSTEVAELADDTARRTMEVNDSSLHISTAVGEIHQELEIQNRTVEQIVGEIGRARGQLKTLSGSVAEIDTIVGTVHAITDQTKILAINATIEAVKAGQFGRGFAVVADEVKKLSQDTALATRDVLEKIEAINATCRSFIDSFDGIAQGADALHRVTVTIAQAINQQRQLCSAIVELTAATGENTREVSTRIAEVNAAAAGVLEHSMTTNHCAEEIARQLGELLSGSVLSLDALTAQESTVIEQQLDHGEQLDITLETATDQCAPQDLDSPVPNMPAPEKPTMLFSQKTPRTTHVTTN
jgi:methyl-accepting chemotaxis protein